MNISMSWQATATLISVVVGASIGVIYDFFRFSRALVGVRYAPRFFARLSAVRLPFIGCPPPPSPPRKRREFAQSLYVAIGDVLFFLCASVVVTVFLYHANNGILRWYLAVGMILGFVLYTYSVGKLTGILLELIAYAIHTELRYLAYFLYRPLRLLWDRIRKNALTLIRKWQDRQQLETMKKYTKKICNTLDNFREIM